MVNKCFITNCKSGYNNQVEKITMFCVPKDEKRLKFWRRIIPRKDRLLSVKDHICIKHFGDKDIIKVWTDGVNTIPLQQYRLKGDACPSIFPDCPKYLNVKPIKKRRTLVKHEIPIKKKKPSEPVVKMPGCCVVSCKNRIYVKRRAKLNAQGISFFRVTDKRRQLWNDALLGIASSTNTICSKHFTKDCFYTSKSHIRQRLKSTAMPTIFYQNFNVHNVELDEHESLDLTDNDPVGRNYNVDPLRLIAEPELQSLKDDDEADDDNTVEESLIMEVENESDSVSRSPVHIDKILKSIGTQTTPPEPAAPSAFEMMKLKQEVKNLQQAVMRCVKELETNVNDLLERLQQKYLDADNMQINMPVICEILEGHFSTFMTDIVSETYSSMQREKKEIRSSFNHDHQYGKRNVDNTDIQECVTLATVEDNFLVSTPSTDVGDTNSPHVAPSIQELCDVETILSSHITSPTHAQRDLFVAKRAIHKQRRIKTFPQNKNRLQERIQSRKARREYLRHKNVTTESANDEIFILVIDETQEEPQEQEMCKKSDEGIT